MTTLTLAGRSTIVAVALCATTLLNSCTEGPTETTGPGTFRVIVTAADSRADGILVQVGEANLTSLRFLGNAVITVDSTASTRIVVVRGPISVGQVLLEGGTDDRATRPVALVLQAAQGRQGGYAALPASSFGLTVEVLNIN